MSLRFIGNIGIILAVALVGIFAFAVRNVHASVVADAEVRYINFQSETKNSPDAKFDASSFSHRYSLLYTTGDVIGNRSGYYKLALGYEWGGIKTKVETPSVAEDISITRGHLLYLGHVFFNPRDLPVRLRLYSYDTQRLAFRDEGGTPLVASTGYILKPGIFTDIDNGRSIVTGGTLLLSYKSGSSTDINLFFSGMPGILIDYVDRSNRSHSFFQTDNRKREFAGVLSSGNNWLHYRNTEYEDFLNKSENYSEKSIIIGNIDPTLDRRWVALTNWISISADGQYKETNNFNLEKSNEYAVHLYTMAERSDWEARTFNSFDRTWEDQRVEYNSRNPVYVSGRINADTDWRSSAAYNVQKDVFTSGLVVNVNDAIGTVKFNTMKRSYFVISPALGIERLERDGQSVSVVNPSIDALSTRRFSDRMSLAMLYDAKIYQYDNTRQDSYISNLVTGKLGMRVKSNLHLEMQEDLVYATGEMDHSLSPQIRSTSIGEGSFNSKKTNFSAGYAGSFTKVRTVWKPNSRLGFEWSAADTFIKPETETATNQVSLKQSVRYDTATLKLYSEINYKLFSEGIRMLSLSGGVSYAPSQVVNGSLYFTYNDTNYSDSITESTRHYEVDQKLKYIYFKRGGFRKLFDITSNLKYEVDSGWVDRKLLTWKVASNYYPTRNTYLNAGGSYQLWAPQHQSQYTAGIGAGITYAKLQAGVDYTYGRRDDIDTRTEKRFSASMRKQF